jgi:hypothetical protein
MTARNEKPGRGALAILALVTCFLFIPIMQSFAAILDSENKIEVTLKDGTHVILYGEAISLSDAKSKNYYYLPVNPRLSMRPDRTPEFLFLKYTTEAGEENKGISGALLHFLMEWGLTPAQETELRDKLKKDFQGAELKGPADVEPDGDDSFRIISATLTDKGMAPVLVKSGRAPVLPGAKVAVAARLDKNAAQLLAATFEKARSISDVSVELAFKYAVRFPAAKGRASIYWSKYQRLMDSVGAVYTKTKKSGVSLFPFIPLPITIGGSGTKYTYDEMRKHFDYLRERDIISISFDENLADERIAKIRDAFFQFFLDHMTAKTQEEVPPPASDKEKAEDPNIRFGNKYTFSQTKISQSLKTGTTVFNLAARMAVNKTFSSTGNMASWYQAARDNPKCVATVRLNDPFFQHRLVTFVLDGDAKDIFENEVNFVTVNIRTKRGTGQEYTGALTFTKESIGKQGVAQSWEYGRDEKGKDAYEYQAQWSLKQLEPYPKNPQWTEGQLEAIYLKPPVIPQKIEFQADLDDLAKSNIARATAQLRYLKFGEESETNISVSPAEKEALVSKVVMMDRDTRGYVYRLILYHKQQGRLCTPWSAKVSDNYIYAVIPEGLTDSTSNVFKAAQDAGKEIIEMAKDKVLDKFKEIFGRPSDEK